MDDLPAHKYFSSRDKILPNHIVKGEKVLPIFLKSSNFLANLKTKNIRFKI